MLKGFHCTLIDFNTHLGTEVPLIPNRFQVSDIKTTRIAAVLQVTFVIILLLLYSLLSDFDVLIIAAVASALCSWLILVLYLSKRGILSDSHTLTLFRVSFDGSGFIVILTLFTGLGVLGFLIAIVSALLIDITLQLVLDSTRSPNIDNA